jgi:hypothetical protein
MMSEWSWTTQPAAVNGTAYTTMATKTTAYTWKPFVAPPPPERYGAAPGTRTFSTGVTLAVIVAGKTDL